ncbi:hypothetical protein D3C86_1797410 [compost metagenome]
MGIQPPDEQIDAAFAQPRAGHGRKPFMQFQLHLGKALAKTHHGLGHQRHRQPRRHRDRQAPGELAVAVSQHLAGTDHLRHQQPGLDQQFLADFGKHDPGGVPDQQLRGGVGLEFLQGLGDRGR